MSTTIHVTLTTYLEFLESKALYKSILFPRKFWFVIKLFRKHGNDWFVGKESKKIEDEVFLTKYGRKE